MSEHRMTRRQVLAGMTAVFSASLLGIADTKAESKKGVTFVLVHGAWHGGWCWKKVRPLLQAAGHVVYTPTLTGLGERVHLSSPEVDLDTHINDIINMLEYEDVREAILIGHSYGGMVITGVATKAPERLAQVVYLDAFYPENGKSLNDYSVGASGYDENVRKNGNGWRLPFAGTLTLQMLGITDPADIAWMSPRMVDQPYRTFTQAIKIPSGLAKSVRYTYILSSERQHYIEAAKRAQAQGFRLVKIPGAGHDIMVTQPRELVDALIAMV
jgi:pimeloyl-ACP methyl ester carboxylesterase